MSDDASSLGDLIKQIAHRKQRAAQSRRKPRPPGTSDAKDVFKEAQLTIAGHLKPEGFELTVSRGRLRRSSGDFFFDIFFNTDRNNISGEYVGLVAMVQVNCPRLKQWRLTNGSLRGADENIAVTQLGDLERPRSWRTWNLAGPQERPQVVADIVETIRLAVLPYFAEFEDVQNVCRQLEIGDLWGFSLLNMFDFAGCYGSMELARSVARRHLLREYDLVDDYRALVKQYRETGVPDRRSLATEEVLAALTVRFDLEDLSA